jgi:hypothetical protein
MSETVVDKLYRDFVDIVELTNVHHELSLRTVAEETFRKALLLAAASHFEHILTSEVAKYCRAASANNVLLEALIHRSAINRKYHTWFDWKKRTATDFFAMFGETFKTHMIGKAKSAPELGPAIFSFMEIGDARNRMVHEDFGTFYLEKTAEEIYGAYQAALPFVTNVANFLNECCPTTNTDSPDAPQVSG